MGALPKINRYILNQIIGNSRNLDGLWDYLCESKPLREMEHLRNDLAKYDILTRAVCGL